ncbi:DUF418 domain-containing protein [Arthrobacter pityocampae]|uniref:DUF418 domain-containing protein n=1 Tax=Arthrobacter pityocampae TaxID=547334 RepID=A0A2S5IVI4_9MICC|nr:DUF418 domain-containing protein [Arthrobacter pityocampae]PPB48578.1 DUF418 domain-containing protein [Arthrobacter pityocampae]
MSDSMTAGSRVAQVDALRGFALLGILMVNVWFFADSSHLTGGRDPSTASPVDLGIRFAVATFFEGKFYLLFSLLFGYGSVVLAAAAGEDRTRLMTRRLIFLGVLGVAHGLTLFYGDILLTYALAGTILVAAGPAGPRARLGLAVGITLGMALLLVAVAVLLPVGGPAAGDLPAMPISPTATPAEALAANAATYGVVLPSVVFFQGPLALAAFFAGSALAMLGVLRPAVPPRSILWRVVVLALPLGLAGAAYAAYLDVWGGGSAARVLATALSVVTSPLVTVGYAAALLLVLGSRAGRVVTAVLAPTGRLSLSNYVAQSVVLCLVFTGYGLGLMDRLPPAVVVVVVVVLFAGQAAASSLLLSRYWTGPLEWTLRHIVRRVPRKGSGPDGA